MRRIIGLDPGLRATGWGVIEVEGNRLVHVASGAVRSAANKALPERLVELHAGLVDVLETYRPDEGAIEETFVSRNAVSTLKLGLARGVVVLVPALTGMPLAEYAANQVKKAVVGVGHADKAQVAMMVRRLLPGAGVTSGDAADALAVAICHAHIGTTQTRWAQTVEAAQRAPGSAGA
jgi:crossover junction endodeoxyribonuclease RuvC